MNLNNLFNQNRLDQYAAYLKNSSLSDASLKRKLSSLTSFQKFLIKNKLIENQSFQNPPILQTSPQNNNLKPNLFSKIFKKTKLNKLSNFQLDKLKSNFLLRYVVIFSIFVIGLGLGFTLYRQAFTQSTKNFAYTTASNPTIANRQLSFQGRLTDSSGNPITSSTTILFKLYDTETVGTGNSLYTSATGNSQTVTPDENGIFSVVIGKTHGTQIPNSVFTENSAVYLEITAGGETMSPRQPIATVAYALNSETLQGLPPSASGLKNTVLVIDELGNINLGETSPTIKSTSGTLGVEAQAVLIKATDGSGGNITINPDANGIIKLTTEGSGSTVVGGFIDATNANLATGNLFNATINNTNRGYKFINFSNYNIGTTQLASRFSVDAYGNTNVGGTLSTTNLTVGSSSLVSNLNADLLDGQHASNFVGVGQTAAFIYSASNGLSLASNTFRLGGLLTQNTDIGLSGFSLSFSDAGSTLVSFSSTGNTFYNPTSFLSGGDVSMAYNLNFTNSSGSNINTAGPFAINTGEVFGSSNLTLKTYNSGKIVMDSSAVNIGGTLTLSQGASNGYILTSDASGNATWTAASGIGGTDVFSAGNGISLTSAGVGRTITNTGIINASNGTLTRSGSAGSYTLGLNLTNSNTWTGTQTFGNLSIGGTFLSVGSTNLVTNLNANYLGGISSSGFVGIGQTGNFITNISVGGSGLSISGSGIGRTLTNTGLVGVTNTTLTRIGSNGTYTVGLNLANANIWTGLQTFNATGAPFAVGSSNLVTNLNADYLDGIQGNVYYKNNDVVMNTNPFGGRRLYLNNINNAYFRADKRWVVTGKWYSSTDDSELGTYSQSQLAVLFDGNYESQLTIPAGSYAKININFSTESSGYFPGYPYGNFYFSHYNTSFPDQTITNLDTMNVYCNYSSQGIGWHETNFYDFSRTGALITKATNNFYNISEVEFKLNTNSTNTRSITELDVELTRPGNNEMPIVDKFKTNTLYDSLNFENGSNTSVININPNGNSYINSGNVGIGTTNPTHKLDVVGDAYFSNSLSVGSTVLATNLNADLLDGYHASNFITTLTGGTDISITSAGVGRTINNTSTLSSVTGRGSSTSTMLSLLGGAYFGSTSQSILKNDGSVGIGTTAPQAKLHVADGMLAITAGQYLNLNNGSTGSGNYGIKATGSSLNLYSGSDTPRVSVYSSTGNVGIGTTAPWAQSTVYGTATTPSLTHGTAAHASWSYPGGVDLSLFMGNAIASFQTRHQSGDGASYPLVFNPLGGNVGIGTTNPTHKLDVVGDAYFSTNLSIGGTFLSVGSTNLTTNLNADLLDGYHASSLPYVNNTTNSTLTLSGTGPYTLGLNLANANNWTGLQTFNATGAPFAVGSSNVVTNLNADLLDGIDSTKILQNSVYYVEGNTSGTAGIWTGTNNDITSYYDGLKISYKIGLNGNSTTTININGLGAIVARRNNGNLTTHLPIGTVANFTYTTISGTPYWVWADYDSNTMDRTYWGTTITAGTTIYDYKLLMQSTDGKWYPLTLQEGIGTTKTISTTEFTINSPILYYATTTNIAPNGTTYNIYSEIPTAYLNYTANQASWTSQLPIYLKGTINFNGKFVLDNSTPTSFMTQTLPTTDDGFVYILLGQMYTTTNLRLFQYHPMYQYKNNRLQQYDPGDGFFVKKIGDTISGNLSIGGTLTLSQGASNGYLLTSDALGNSSWVNPTTLGLGTTYSAGSGLSLTSGVFKLGGALTENTRLNIGSTEALYIQFATGNIGIGTTNPSAKLTLASTPTYESAQLGSELLNSSNWTSTDWTGDFTSGFTHTTGNTTNLTNSLAAVIGNYYQISYTVTNRTTGSFTLSFGGESKAGLYNNGTFGPKATTVDNLIITPTSDFNGTIVISIKQIIGNSIPIFAFYDNTGTSSFEIRNSLASLNNTFIGRAAGSNNTTGSYNTAQGYEVLNSNTTGSNNSAQGYGALNSNTTGSNNSAQGYASLYKNISGSNNSAQGYASLYSNTTGNQNTAQGYRSLYSNTTGNYNSAQGYTALTNNTTGSYNTAQGYGALNSNITSSFNTANGFAALQNITSGNSNTALGYNAGRYYNGTTNNLTSITSSLLLGVNTSALNATGDTNEIVIGYNAIGNGSNSVVLGNDSINNTILKGNIGLGTTNPTRKLDVVGDAYFSNSLSVGSTVLATNLNADLLDGYHASSFEVPLTFSNGLTRTGNNIHLGGELTEATRFNIGSTEVMYFATSGDVSIGATDSESSKLHIYDSSKSARINLQTADVRSYITNNYDYLLLAIGNGEIAARRDNGNVGIGLGNNNPTHKLDVVGDAYFSTNLSIGGTFLSVGSTNLTTNLNADLLDGYHASSLPYVNNTTNSTLTLSGTGPYTLGLNLANANNWTGLQNFASNVGIGTTDPTESLEVVGNVKISGDLTAAKFSDGDNSLYYLDPANASSTNSSLSLTTSGSLRFNYKNDGTHAVTSSASRIQNFTNGLLLGVSSSTSGTVTGWDNNLFLATSGNVGIGTTNPNAKLTVAGNIYPSVNLSYDIGSSDYRWNNAWIKTVNIGSSTWSLQSPDNSRFSFFNSDVGGTEAMTILSSGNVGIGTTNPLTKLQVNVGTNMNLAIRNGNYDPTATLIQSMNDDGTLITPMEFRASNFSIMGGDVGIGTTNPNYPLDVNGWGSFNGGVNIINTNNNLANISLSYWNDGTKDWPRIRYGGNGVGSANGFLIQGGGDSVKLAILNSGNIGIGTTDPTNKLMVTGNDDGTHNGAQLRLYEPTDGKGLNLGTINGVAGIIQTTGSIPLALNPIASNVGIGTTNPSYKLDVNLGATAAYPLSLTSSGKFLHVGALNSSYVHIDTDATSGVYFYDDVTTAGAANIGGVTNANGGLSQDGNVILNGSDTWLRTTAATGWYNSTYSVGVYASQAGRVDIFNGASLYVPATVGVNTTTISETLTVNGSGMFGTAGASEVLLGENINNLNHEGIGIWHDGTYGNISSIDAGNVWQTIVMAGDGGNVSIGAAPSFGLTYDLEVHGNTLLTGGGSLCFNDTNTYIGIPAANTLSFYTSSTQRVRIDNTGYVTFYNGHNDLAENYLTSGKVLRGSLVSIDQTKSKTIQASTSTNSSLIGVVSTAPGAVMDEDGGFTIGSQTKPQYENEKAPIALVGTVPTLVTSQNGIVNIGDAIGISNIPGFGAKTITAGNIVGRALENLDTNSCTTVSSFDSIVWPEDDGKNTLKPCFKLPDGTYIGKIMITLSPSWYDPDVQITATGDVNVNYNISDSVLASLGYSDSKNEIETATYKLTDSTGRIVDRLGQFSEIAAAKIKTGLLSATNIVTKNLISEKTMTRELVSPKANIDQLTAIDIQTTSITTDELKSDKLTSREATISTLYADNIISKEGSFGNLMAEKVSAVRDELKKLITDKESSSSAITGTSIASQTSDWRMNIASDSAEITGDLAITNNLVIGAKLLVNGDTQLANAFITGTFSAGEISIKDNFIETTNTALYIQPSNTGSIHMMGETLVIAENGEVQINGNLAVSGSLFANLITANEVQTQKLTAVEINSDQVKIATDSAQVIIAESGFAALATSSANLTSNATAGTATLPAGKTEIIINNNKITNSSMVYITPVGSTKNQVPYIKAKVISESESYFTIALDNPLDQDIEINWWIIN